MTRACNGTHIHNTAHLSYELWYTLFHDGSDAGMVDDELQVLGDSQILAEVREVLHSRKVDVCVVVVEEAGALQESCHLVLDLARQVTRRASCPWHEVFQVGLADHPPVNPVHGLFLLDPAGRQIRHGRLVKVPESDQDLGQVDREAEQNDVVILKRND